MEHSRERHAAFDGHPFSAAIGLAIGHERRSQLARHSVRAENRWLDVQADEMQHGAE